MSPNAHFDDDFEFVGEVVAGSAEAAAQTISADDQVRELRHALSLLTVQIEKRKATNDGRLVVLESLLGSSESRIGKVDSAVTGLGQRLREEGAFRKVQIGAIQASLEETAMLGRDNSSRLDRLVVKYLPEIENKVRASEELCQRQGGIINAKINEIRHKVEVVGATEIAEVRRLATEASLRSLLVERKLPDLKADIVAAMASEIVAMNQEAKGDRETADTLCNGHLDLCGNIRELTIRLEGADRVVRHLSGTVVPLLEGRIQEQAELIAVKEVELKKQRLLTAEREIALLRRVDALEAAVIKAQESAMENARLRNRLTAVEAAAEHLSNDGAVSISTTSRTTLEDEMIAEVERRERRRRVPTVKALRAELIKREVCSEIRRRREKNLRNQVVTSRVLNGDYLRHAVVSEIARSQQRSMTKACSFSTGIVHMKCKSLSSNICIDVVLPRFVSISYLKQLIYFKTDCTALPNSQTLVYAGMILQDNWKIGGGLFTAPGCEAEDLDGSPFQGVRDCSTVLVVVRKD